MKTLLMTIGLALSYTASAQWVTKKVDNGFDTPYKIAYTNVAKNQWLKLENYNNEISFYIGGVYICDDIVNVDMSFLVNGVYQKYNIIDCYVGSTTDFTRRKYHHKSDYNNEFNSQSQYITSQQLITKVK